MNKNIDMDILIKYLKNLLENENIDFNCKKALSSMPEYECLYDSLFEIRNAIIDIGKGKLDYKINSKGYFAGAVKSLQSTLLHLMWQTKSISSGNFVQTVDFLGEFSDAFNTMTEQVEQNINQITNLENESREAKEHFEAIFNTSPDATMISSLEGKIIDVNDAFFDILGYKKDEVIGNKDIDIGLFKYIDDRLNVVEELRNKGECKNIELTLVTKNKVDITVLNSSKIIKLKDEPHAISVSRDITELKKVQENLIKTEIQFQNIVKNLPFSLTMIKRDGTVLYANSKAYELFNISENIIGTKSTYLVWDDPKQREKWLKCIEKDGFVKSFEAKVRTIDGKQLYVICSGFMFKYQGQDCILSTQIDITERKTMEEALRKSEEKYRLLTEFASDVIWILNVKARRFTYMSPSIIHLRGITAEDAIKETLEQALTPESLKYVEDKLKINSKKFLESPNNSHGYTHEIQQPHKDGHPVWVEISTKYRYNDKGEIEVVGVSRNIEERKRSEKEVLYLSYNDQLTGLYNRRFYEEKLISIDNKENLPISLVMTDVNGLKLTNDAFGHVAGDTLLKTVADIFRRECRKDDIISRIGGDEFVLLLPKTTSLEAEKLIKRIKNSLLKEKLENIVLSVSFGCQTKHKVDEDINKIYTQAEDCMYKNKLSESKNMKKKTIELILNNINKKDPDANTHAKRVSDICIKIGKSLNLDEDTISNLGSAGLMHDIGNISINKKIFEKRGKLDEFEWSEVKKHPEIGYQILRSTSEFSNIADCILSHHERLDGTGYPSGIKKNEISLHAKILALADAYVAMTSDRTYSNALSEEESIEEIKRNTGTQFDEYVAKVFVEKVLKRKWNIE